MFCSLKYCFRCKIWIIVWKTIKGRQTWRGNIMWQYLVASKAHYLKTSAFQYELTNFVQTTMSLHFLSVQCVGGSAACVGPVWQYIELYYLNVYFSTPLTVPFPIFLWWKFAIFYLELTWHWLLLCV